MCCERMDDNIFTSLSGFDLKDINKEFDNGLYNIANQFRKESARFIILSRNYAWKEYEIQGGMLSSVLERQPFENTENILKFNIAVTEEACNRILNSEYPLICKIGMYAYVVEIGAREFISPENLDVIYKNLSAAKERGFFFTPPSLAVRMVLVSLEKAESKKYVLDPAAGVGVFLAYHMMFNKDLVGVVGTEIDYRTSELANKLLLYVATTVKKTVQIDVRCEDFLEFFREMNGKEPIDIIIMNPPYGAVKVLASDFTDTSTKAQLNHEEIKILEKRLKKKTIDYASQLRQRFLSYGIGKGTLEYSKLFMAVALEMLSKDGLLVSITPSSWLGDETSSVFRKKIIQSYYLHELWIIPEKAKMFRGVNQPTVVSLLSKKPATAVTIYNPVLRIESVDGDSESFGMDTVISVSGEKCKFPKCTLQELKILKKIQKYGKIKDISSVVNMRGELDLTANKKYISVADTGHRLVRGDHIQGSILASVDSSEKAGYVLYQEFLDVFRTSEKTPYIQSSRIAIPQCSYLQKKKRIEAAIVPKAVVLANSCNFIALKGACDDIIELRYYWMIMNSSVVEWQFRIFSYNNHVANKEIDALSCIPYKDLSEKEKIFIQNQALKSYNLDEFSVLQDAFVAKVFGLSEKEYTIILKSINAENAEECILEYKKMSDGSKKIEIPQHQMPSLSELDKLMISYVEPGGNWTSIPETVPSKRLNQIREMARTRGMVRTTYYSRLRYNQPAYTISTYFNRPGNGANIHPWEDRTLSSREAARLQSFPDCFVFEGSDAAVRTQIGNAVPPLLGYAVGRAIKKKVGMPLKFCDMFAGAGGLSYGMELAGYRGVAALELNKFAAASFARNHDTSIKTIVGDINDETIQQELFSAIKQGIEQGEPWVLVGGPPCQGFSTAGYRNENDIRNKLVDSYLKIIQVMQPAIVVMENVPGILSMKKGDVIKGVYQSLHRLGYVFHKTPWVLDAERYGVPQMRRRVIIVAAKEECFLPDYPEPIFEKCMGRRENVDNQISLSLSSYPITVGEALKGLPPLMEINDYFPKDASIDDAYNKWCQGEISVEELLKERG